MGKKLCGVLLVLVMAFSLLPTVATAATTDFNDGSWTELTKEYLESEEVDYTLHGGCYYLDGDVTLDKTLVVTGASEDDTDITLDLNGHVLQYTGTTEGSVIVVQSTRVPKAMDSGAGYDEYPTRFVLQDSDPTREHKFTKGSDGLWKLDETAGTESISGGVITGGTGREISADADCCGGGIYIFGGNSSLQIAAEMAGGSIVGCTANRGGGVYVGKESSFTMSGSAQICGCTATTPPTVPDISSALGRGGGIYNDGTLTLKGSARITDCTAADAKSYAIYSYNGGNNAGTIYADGGEVYGTVYSYGSGDGRQSRITRSEASSAVTRFYGDVTNRSSVIEDGIFYGTVTNEVYEVDKEPGNPEGGKINAYGKITGGTFYSRITSDDSSFQCYTVTFKRNDGTEDTHATLYVVSGNKVTQPADPTREGYTFADWYNGDAAYVFNAAVTGDLTLTAKWEGSSTKPAEKPATSGGHHTIETDTVTSPKTFDAGTALYAAMAAASLLGMGYMGKKR